MMEYNGNGIIPDVPIEAKLVPSPHFLIFDLS